jgi:hypothetical protein
MEDAHADLIAGLETVGAATLGTDRAEHDAGEEEKADSEVHCWSGFFEYS